MASDVSVPLPAARGRRSRLRSLRARAFCKQKLALLYAVFTVQFLSALFFVGELWSEVLGIRHTPIPYAWQEYIQFWASIGLVVGVITSFAFLTQTQRRMASMHRQIDVTSGKYQNHLMGHFDRWGLSPSERAVTICAMKGFSNSEIAELRGTSASTIKSQMKAVFRKTELQNRQQLIAFMVEELLVGMEPEPASGSAAAGTDGRQQTGS
ncbi:helix-turn-helix transcriptional regulator [Frigidibacter sp. ROC022]|uniref:helix-turn-helix transcriptional regulator n=1 Tax=Frigidibacter sp. ROC022 TaxID=2971796 RepID=UPI00215A49C2|nr:helix-turn-helix transcriptional regulator [Frigidibacter sp. ROC022]MCR8723393.1 helix-turn-helix transcriptional regulator [Frigidibacter sp. ROC022]